MNVNPITMAGCKFISQLDLKLLSFADGIVTLLCVRACVLSHFCHVWLFVTIRTVSCQVLLPVWFSRQEYWSGVPRLLQGSSWLRHWTHISYISCIGRQVLYHKHHLGSPLIPKIKPFLESKIGKSNCGYDQGENKMGKKTDIFWVLWASYSGNWFPHINLCS